MYVSLLFGLLQFYTLTGKTRGENLKFSQSTWQKEIYFSNSTGTTLPCSAIGFPIPSLKWINFSNSSLRLKSHLHENQLVGLNSSSRPLRIFPFSPSEFNSQLHSNSYICVASNSLGMIRSPPIRLRAVMDQDYDLQVFPSYSYPGNIAVLKCLIPPFVKEYLSVESWLFGSLSIVSGGRYSIFPKIGELHIRNVSVSDEMDPYRCVGHHLLTGKKTISSISGRLSIQRRSSPIPVRIEKSSNPSEIKAEIGSSIEIPCVALGLPPPTYKWFHASQTQNAPLLPSIDYFVTEGTLLITRVSSSHGGKWTCRASNSRGYESSDVHLIVQTPLSLRLCPPVQRVDVGKEVRIECAFRGFPLMNVYWAKDGVQLTLLPRGEILRGDNVSTLRIHAMDRRDKGLYQCFVEGETEILSQVSQLDLGNSKANLISTFDHQVLQPGSSLSISCKATGSPLPSISWFVDDRPIHGGLFNKTQGKDVLLSTLDIISISVSEGGHYSCVAENDLGSMTHGRRVDVYGPPFIKPMDPVSVLAGSNFLIHCPYTGYPILQVKWSKNGEILPVNERQRVFESNASLQIQNIQLTDKGEYTCTVSNEMGVSVRENFELSVAVSPKIEPFTFKDDLQVGGRIRVSCTASLGDLPIKFEWLFNNHRLLEGEHSNGISITTVDAFSSSLVILKLSTGHSGNFTCIASNSAASDTYSSSLTVNVPLSWRVSPSDENIMSGESVRLDCLVNGVPSPTITWYKEYDNTPGSFYNISQNNSKFRIYPNGSLFIDSASGQNDGTYLCKAENGISVEGLSKLARLVVNVPAKFLVPKVNQTASLASRTIISCPVLGNNPIRVLWTRNHQSFTSSTSEHIKIKEEVLPKGMTSKLVIHNLHRDDSALFQCFASNQFGKAVRSIRLIVQEPPEVPNNPSIVSFSSRNANISWSKPYDGRSQITAYIIQYKMENESWREASTHIVSGTSNWAELQSLAPSHAYEIRMSAENGVGISRKSPILKLRAKEEIPEGPPTGIRAIANGSQSIIVTWRAPHPELRHGVILGYYLGYKVRNSSEPFRYQTLEMKHRHERRRKETLELILYHLKKYTEYSIVVQAYNGVGAGPRNPEIHIRTDEDVPSAPPSNVACTPLSSTSLLVLWSPPQPTDINGVLKDYRVFYRPLREWEDNALVRDLRTSGLKINLYDLDKYQNYTIQVVASTRIGEGLRSRSIYCRTKEDIPGSPQNIKALSLDQHSILVSWLPPKSPNGKIIHHSVFMKTMEGGRQFTQNFEVHPPSTSYTIRGLNQNQPYSFWVTCSTIEGRGLESEIVTETPSLPIPASIASFSQSMFGAMNEEIFFPCISIGKPKPRISWTFNGESLHQSSRILVDQTRDNSLWITRLELTDSGNYSCFVKNHFGSDSIQIFLTVKKSRNNGVPPAPPTLSVVQTTPSSITLGWTPSADGGSPLLGYRIHHHREFGDWDRTDINPHNNSFTLKSLRCGTHYQFYIQGVNDFGVGERTETVSARTRGTSPIAPFNEDFISVNSTSIVLKLDAWRTGGCPISSFVVEYKKSEKLGDSSSWILVNNNVKMTEDRTFAVLDLSPQTAYSLRITAHNSAGSTIEEYSFITLTFTGATIAPELIIHSGYGGIGFLLSPGFLLSFFSVILLAIIIGVIVRLKWPLFQRSRRSDSNNMMTPHLCSNNESDKQIILPQSISEETRNIQNEYLLDGFCPPSKSYGTLSRKKAYGKPIILQHHHHHVHHPGNFYSEDSNIDPIEDPDFSTQQEYYRHYIPDETVLRDTQSKEESTNETEVMGTDGNWIPLTHLIGAQRL